MINYSSQFPSTRLRRLRQHPKLRDLVRETQLHVNDLMTSLFIHHGRGIKNEIRSMPGQYQLSIDYLEEEIQEISKLNIPAVMLFGIPEHKDATGSFASHPQGVIQQAIQTVKNVNPDLLVMTDLCFCEYTDHSHCGILRSQSKQWDVDNDATLEILAQQAVSHATAGADVIVPSGNIDGNVGAIRQALDKHGFSHIPILSHAAKYASALYGPFREAANSVIKNGDRKTYQLDPANGQESLREISLDLQEGADMVIVKPATFYTDVIYRCKQNFPGVPIAAYHVGGEYAMIKAAAQNGWIDEKKIVLEALTAIKRAGADFIITYYAKDVAKWLNT